MSQDIDQAVFIFLSLSCFILLATALFTDNNKLSDRAYEWSILLGVLLFSFVLPGGSSTKNLYEKLIFTAFVYLFGLIRGTAKQLERRHDL